MCFHVVVTIAFFHPNWEGPCLPGWVYNSTARSPWSIHNPDTFCISSVQTSLVHSCSTTP